MSSQWSYLQEGQLIGPIDEDDLRELFSSGALKSSTPIRCSDLGESNWKPAIAVAEFKDAFRPSKPVDALEIRSAVQLQEVSPIVVQSVEQPVEVLVAPQEGANVVKWMWRFAFAAWAICFLPVPGLSTFLVWLFAAVSGTLAFVALFKNRVGSGVGGTVALVLITPAMWFLSLAVYPMLMKPAMDAHDAQQRSRPQTSSQTTAPENLVVRHKCLAYKCGSDGRIVSDRSSIGLSDFKNRSSQQIIPAGTVFKFIEGVSYTAKPSIATVTRDFRERDHMFRRGDRVYLYAEWGEGCRTAWSKGKTFAFPGSLAESKHQIQCIGYENLNTVVEGKSENFIYATFDIEGQPTNLYFNSWSDAEF